jgi:hypothetical protein
MDTLDDTDLPDGWKLTTELEHHLTFLSTPRDEVEEGHYGLAAVKHQVTSKWSVRGLSGFPDAPLFGTDLSRETAIATAIDVMEDPEAAADRASDQASPASASDQSSHRDTSPSDSTDADERERGENDEEQQGTLDEWIEG